MGSALPFKAIFNSVVIAEKNRKAPLLVPCLPSFLPARSACIATRSKIVEGFYFGGTAPRCAVDDLFCPSRMFNLASLHKKRMILKKDPGKLGQHPQPCLPETDKFWEAQILTLGHLPYWTSSQRTRVIHWYRFLAATSRGPTFAYLEFQRLR